MSRCIRKALSLLAISEPVIEAEEFATEDSLLAKRYPLVLIRVGYS